MTVNGLLYLSTAGSDSHAAVAFSTAACDSHAPVAFSTRLPLGYTTAARDPMSRETPCPWLPVSHPVPQTPHTSLGQQFRSGPYTGPTYLYGPLERCAPRRAYEHCAAAGQAAGAYLIMSLSSRPNPIAERPHATLDDAADAPPSEISSSSCSERR